MRMWMVSPKILCQKHLCGEHVETHMFLGTIKKKISIQGYLKNNLLEPSSLEKRHQDLANEMIKRGYNHNSSFTQEDVKYILDLPADDFKFTIDRDLALQDLIQRCPLCWENFKKGIIK